MWKLITFVGVFLRTLYQHGLVEGRRLPTSAEIKAEYVAFKQGNTRVAPIGATGRVFAADPRVTLKLKSTVTKIRVIRAKTGKIEDIEVNK